MNPHVHKLTRLALLLALATVIHTIEAFLPITVVWFRFGFANIITVTVLYVFGFKDALILTMGRVFLGSVAVGLFGSPAFLLALAGAICSVFAMGGFRAIGSRVLSEVGISIIGAVFHNMGQLSLAYFILVRNEAIFLLLPLMILAAIATGFINGLAARFLIARLRETDAV